jgi:hypothetical protein
MYQRAVSPLSIPMTCRDRGWRGARHRTNLIKPFDAVPAHLLDAAKRIFTRFRASAITSLASSRSAAPDPYVISAESPEGD